MNRYPHYVTISRVERIPAGRSYTTTLVEVAAVWAMVKASGGNKRELFGGEVVEEPFSVSMQYDPRISPGDDLQVTAEVNGNPIDLDVVAVAPSFLPGADLVLSCRRRKDGQHAV